MNLELFTLFMLQEAPKDIIHPEAPLFSSESSSGSSESSSSHSSESPDEIEWDVDNSATEIDTEGVWVYVKNGVGPYTWELDGSGVRAALENEQTEGLGNRLVPTGGGDVCGVFDITVTDSRGDSAVGHVISVDGYWWSCQADNYESYLQFCWLRYLYGDP